MGTFTFDATPTEAQLRAATRRASRPALLILRGGGLFVALFGLAQLLNDEFSRPVAAGVAVVGVLMFLLLPAYKIRQAGRQTTAKLARPTSYRVDGVGLYSGNDLGDGTIRWPLIRAVEELPRMNVVLARVGKAMFVPIPVDGLAPHVRAALLAFMHANAGSRPIPGPSGGTENPILRGASPSGAETSAE